jgi:hypothetical protein
MALTTNGPQAEAPDSLYTTLLIISAVTLLIGIVFVIVRSFEFFGSIWPKGTVA